MKLVIVETTSEEIRKLRAEHDQAELTRIRLATRIESMADAEARLELVNTVCENNLVLFTDALMNLDEVLNK